MKILSIILTLTLLSSCADNWAKEEARKSEKSNSASSRINSSEKNSKDAFKELDE